MKNINPDRIIVALSFIGLLAISACSIFDPRIDVVPVAELHNQLTPAMREAMADLSSLAMTAKLHRIQGDLNEVEK